MGQCIQCNKSTKVKYCSNACQSQFQYEQYILRWKAGKVDGNRDINAKNLSRSVIRYLHEKFKDSCSLCGWSKVNPITKKVPLEIDHIDGDNENNREENLRLICPNCHSLTSSYRNLNRGNGRKWRRDKYNKVVDTPL